MRKIELEVTIMPELRDLIPPLTPETRAKLRASIAEEGQQEPIVLWEQFGQRIVVDGHNRHSICLELGIQPRYKFAMFANLTEVKDWMIERQLGRRNLTPEQAAYLRGLKAQQYGFGHGGTRGPAESNKRTREEIGEELGVSGKTVARNEAYAKGLDYLEQECPGVRAAILAGKAKISQGAITDAPKYFKNKMEDGFFVVLNSLEDLHEAYRLSKVEASGQAVPLPVRPAGQVVPVMPAVPKLPAPTPEREPTGRLYLIQRGKLLQPANNLEKECQAWLYETPESFLMHESELAEFKKTLQKWVSGMNEKHSRCSKKIELRFPKIKPLKQGQTCQFIQLLASSDFNLTIRPIEPLPNEQLEKIS